MVTFNATLTGSKKKIAYEERASKKNDAVETVDEKYRCWDREKKRNRTKENPIEWIQFKEEAKRERERERASEKVELYERIESTPFVKVVSHKNIALANCFL